MNDSLLGDLRSKAEQCDPFRHEDKRLSWNVFGADHWLSASEMSRPSSAEIDGFLRGADPSIPVLVLGGTTVELIAAALDRGADVHVLDFAERVLQGVEGRFGASNVSLHLHDLIRPAPPSLFKRFAIVACDRLITRFHRSEMPRVLATMLAFVCPHGALRASVRFGLSPFDESVIETGRRMGTLDRFWNPATRTIDWALAGDELSICAQADGNIPREIVIAWSRLRGVETRLEPPDIGGLIEEAAKLGMRSRLDWEMASDRKLNLRLFSIVPA
jgi:hypothetical protein